MFDPPSPMPSARDLAAPYAESAWISSRSTNAISHDNRSGRVFGEPQDYRIGRKQRAVTMLQRATAGQFLRAIWNSPCRVRRSLEEEEVMVS